MDLDGRGRERLRIERSEPPSVYMALEMPTLSDSRDFVSEAGAKKGMVRDRSVFACCSGGEGSEW